VTALRGERETVPSTAQIDYREVVIHETGRCIGRGRRKEESA